MTGPPLRRRPWPWVVGVVVLVIAGLTAPRVWSGFVFSSSRLVGLTSAEVRARCGEPQFASVRGAPADSEFSPPVWGRMSQATRDRLVAQPEFYFGYEKWMGDRWKVEFKNGTVVGTERFSK